MVLSEIRKRIHNKEYAANSIMSAYLKGFKTVQDATPLIDTGKMIREVLLAQRIQEMKWEVGALGKAVHPKSRKPYSLIIPIIHEGATISMKIGTVSKTVRIPPRPFLRAVWEDERYKRKFGRRDQMRWSEF
jgi:hypothetical protein